VERRGIILFFNQRWVNPQNETVKERVCCPDIEQRSFGFHVFYVLREFPYTVVIVVYIPPRAAPTTACVPLLGYRPSTLKHSLQSQGISTTSLYPPA